MFCVLCGAWYLRRVTGHDAIGASAFFFGIPVTLFGVLLLSTPWWSYQKTRKTIYVITDRRAITFDDEGETRIRSYPPSKLQKLHRKEKADGTGDVILAEAFWTDTDGGQQTRDLGFLGIRDPKTVEQMLKKLAEHATAN